jgi:hypothetical protein
LGISVDILVLAPFGLSSVITLVVGARLLTVAARRREIPELAIGLVMILELISAMSWALASATAAGQLVSTLAAAASASTLGLFISYTFVPHSRLARVGAAALVIAAGACVLLPWLAGAWGSEAFYREFGWGASLVRVFGYGWGAHAAARSRDALRRRAALGLCHPLTVSRVGFWSIASACACLSFLMPIFDLVAGITLPGRISFVSAGIAIAASSLIWLAFYPPKAYVAWALRQAGQT